MKPGLITMSALGTVATIAIYGSQAVTTRAMPETTITRALADAREIVTAADTTVLAQADLASGNFVAAEHPTAGTARIVTENGQRYLEFSADFLTDSGPDLFVLLHRSPTPETYAPEDYVNLGELQQVSGIQRYAIPAELDIADFNSAVIWCRQFNATFGFASFN
jgi:hypothetical protein